MKSNAKMIFGILVGALLFGGIGGYAASMISSRDITYTASNSKFKAGNVGDALDTLYVMGLSSMDASPIGVVSAYMGTTAPGNYLLCDGTTYNITEYQELADHIKNNFGSYNFFGGDGEATFAVPDLRGEFLRGTGTNSHTGQGNGANVGVHQDGGAPNITGSFGILGNGARTSNMSVNYADGAFYAVQRGGYRDAYTDGNNTNATYYAAFSASRSNALHGAADEIRPTNTSVNFIIKAK